MPPPRLLVYARETAIAEKVEAIVQLGTANSRMKDFFDIWFLATNFVFEEDVLRTAIRATFDRRRTPVPTQMPLALTDVFATDPAKAVQWRAFVAKSRLSGAPPTLETVIRVVAEFIVPAFLETERSAARKSATWRPDLGWRRDSVA